MDDHSCPTKNYIRLLETIEELENVNFRFTEDWYERHKKYILKYREVFPNFKYINQDTKDKRFRALANDCEIIISNLVRDIKMNNQFDLEMYLMLVKNFKTLMEILDEDANLAEMIAQLSMDF